MFWIILLCEFGQRVNDHFHHITFFIDLETEPGNWCYFKLAPNTIHSCVVSIFEVWKKTVPATLLKKRLAQGKHVELHFSSFLNLIIWWTFLLLLLLLLLLSLFQPLNMWCWHSKNFNHILILVKEIAGESLVNIFWVFYHSWNLSLLKIFQKRELMFLSFTWYNFWNLRTGISSIVNLRNFYYFFSLFEFISYNFKLLFRLVTLTFLFFLNLREYFF